jgi:hypothetical protein
MNKIPAGRIKAKEILEKLHRQDEDSSKETEVKKKFKPDRNVAVLLYGPPPVLRKKE